MTESVLSYGPKSKQKSLCDKKCKDGFLVEYNSLTELKNCLKECEYSDYIPSHLQKLMFNDLNEKLEISEKNLHDAQNLLPTVLAYDINQDSLF